RFSIRPYAAGQLPASPENEPTRFRVERDARVRIVPDLDAAHFVGERLHWKVNPQRPCRRFGRGAVDALIGSLKADVIAVGERRTEHNWNEQDGDGDVA